MKKPEEKQNVTLSLPKRLMRRAKVVAAERETSVSAIVTDLLRAFVAHQDGADAARREAIADMRRGLGYRIGDATWTRDELHDR